MSEPRVRAWGAELRAVHARLRDALEIARESIVEGGALESAGRDLLIYCWGFCTALTGHHRSEGGALFPEVLAARPDLAPVIDELVRDHTMLDHLIGGLEQALTAGAPVAETLRHLDGIDAVMETHFRYEELRLAAVLDGLDHTAHLDRTTLFGPIA